MGSFDPVQSPQRKMEPVSPPKHFPYCVVWCPIPLVTWIYPFIGHMGIGLANGSIMDFAGPYYVGLDNFAFGNPTRYLQMDPSRVPDDLQRVRSWSESWDESLGLAAQDYRSRFYRFFTDNCHCFVARALNLCGYGRGKNWDMVMLAGWMFVAGRYVGIAGFLKTWLPFLVLAGVGGYFLRLMFLYVYLCVFGVGVVWFLFCSYVLRPAMGISSRDRS